ncbi:methyl-accepting chemotaxis sensory transducer with Cache sensor [Paenibacillus curdlanolyticus YK9]|uniref:Methyl-accepting chemotaxis sensory transducer with Cache sensor n=1 Tax=Paenibacillus curdlanolyticus YK9 TaxID=717606 RepID=E0ID17_9BACL|nr:methyl-accepting chemotaxis protein [Paenibacillus curdlanolyticus]EFM09472.1 methyl-accepting chemotaxis sensory transducer with Cache sensor [Paenibacillus curdlanolyticus YK9]
MESKGKLRKLDTWIGKFAMRSFKARMIVIFLLISLVPMVFSTVFFSNYLKNVVTDEIHTKEEAVVTANVAAVDYSIQRQVAFLKELVATNKDVKSGNVPAVIDFFKKLEAANKEVEQYVYVDKHDMATTTAMQKLSVADRDYTKQARAAKLPIISDLLVSKATGSHIIVIYVPILDEQENYMGGVFCSLTTASLDVFTKTIKIGESGFGYLLSPSGMLITYPDPSKVGKNIEEVFSPAEVDAINRTVLEEEKGRYSITDEQGVARQNSYDRIPSTGWRLVSSVATDEVYASVQSAKKMSIILAVATAVVVAAVALFISMRMVKPITAITSAVKKLATGDLTPRLTIRRYDELGQLADNMNQTLDSFSDIVGKASFAAEQVAASSEELTATAIDSLDISNRIVQSTQEVLGAGEVQLQGAEQTSIAMNEMAIGVQRIAESSSVVTEASFSSLQEVQKGRVAITEAVEQMKSVHHSVGKSAEDMRALEGYSQQIGSIVSVITDITNQTQLLSLNASIEAARAGEQGRGFAVVANEVKKLAELSSASAADIANLIREVQTATARAVLAMNQGVSDVDRGADLIHAAGDIFNRISLTFEEISDQIQEVSAASQQMSAGTEEVTASMGEIVNMADNTYRHTQDISEGSTQQKVSMQEISSSAEHLSNMAQELQESLAQFKTK